jgi:putative colanic acid biosynthesis acetyltransferase WcaF
MADQPIYQDLSRFRVSRFSGKGQARHVAVAAVQSTLFRLSPQPLFRLAALPVVGVRRKVGRGVLIRPSARVTYPWKVVFGDYCWIGDDAEIYSLGPITIGANAVVSQRSYICAGTHDYGDIAFSLVAKPVTIEPGFGSRPGVSSRRGDDRAWGFVAACSTVLADVPAAAIVAGAPARFVRTRMPA